MENDTYRWHFDYTRLAWESGFSFESNKNRKTFDRNKIALLDIDRIIKERDIAIVESHLNNILDFNLDNDELKILDNSFVKLFQLYQLSIEFLMYCKKFLDKTVVTLKTDLQKNIEDNEFLQKELARVISENNRLKKRNKDLKLTLHYQHQFQHNLNDQMTIYQCTECGKTFINNEYLNGHLKRRHNIDQIVEKENIADSAENTLHTTPEHEKYKTETDRLQSEIKVLKEKLNNTERYFNPDIMTGNLSPEHGTVRIQKNSTSSESHKDINELKKQFESLKNVVHTELDILRAQKFAETTQEKLLQKVIEKLDRKNEAVQVETIPSTVINERRNSYVQTDDSDFQNLDPTSIGKKSPTVDEDVKDSKSKQVLKKNHTRVQSVIKDIEVSSEESDIERPHLDLVKEEVEKKLEEKTKKEIDELAEQLNIKMAKSFNLLEERMETFWNKLNEKTSQLHQTPSPIPSYNRKQSTYEANQHQTTSVDTKTKPKLTQSIGASKIDIKPTKMQVSSSESDSLSETESNRQIISDIEISEEEKPKPLPRKDKQQQKLIEELKTKVNEGRVVKEIKIKSSDEPEKRLSTKFVASARKKDVVDNKPKLEEFDTVQKPVVTKVFSKPIRSFQTETSETEETSSESETESSSEEEEEEIEEKPAVKQKIIKNVQKEKKVVKETPIQKQFMKRSQSAPLRSLKPPSREDILEDYNNRLQKLGIDPEAMNLQNKDYKEKSELLLQNRTEIEKKNPNSFTKIRDQILKEIETKIQGISHPNIQKITTPTHEISPKPSRFKSIMSSVKTKLISSIKTEKSPVRTSTPLYKLSIHREIPKENLSEEEKEKVITPKKHVKKVEKNPVKREKIIIKPKKMYADSESETKSDDEIVNKRKTGSNLENLERKSISVTSLNAPVSEKGKKGSVQNIAQSLDSILEMKKEIIAEINREDLEEGALKNFSSSEESLNEISKKSPTNIQQQKFTYEIPEQKIERQKGVSKNFIPVKKSSSEESLQKPSPNYWEPKLTYEIPEQKTDVHKGVLKNYPSAMSMTKKKVIFDLSEDSEHKSDPIENVVLPEPKKVKTNSFFDFDLSKDDDSTSVTSSVFDGSKLNLDQSDSEKGKIKTKAQINVVESKKGKESESDFDISDLL